MGCRRGASRGGSRQSWQRWLALALLAGVTSFALVERPARAGAPARTTGPSLPAVAGLRVIPFPGTPDASPRSPVIFSSLSPAAIRSVRVTGSRSGVHPGRLEVLPAGAGTAFVPRVRFVVGETVQVVARLRSRAAGSASGDPLATRLSFSFGVGPAAGPRHSVASRRTASWSHTAGARAARAISARSFRSDPGLSPPAVNVSADPDTSSGDIFLSPRQSGNTGLMILSSQGHLVWFDKVRDELATDLAVQSYQGQPVLTWYQGPPYEDVIVNRSYQTVAVVKAANGYATNSHEFLVTPQGTAWLEATTEVPADLSSVGGPTNGELLDYVIQEVDIKTGQLLWQWDSYGHIPLTASHWPIPNNGNPWDAFHLNSIQVLPNGNLLVSCRHAWSVYEISRQTGQILWTLGGTDSQFAMGRGTQFRWQHDARLNGNTLTLFNDGAAPHHIQQPQSWADALAVNFSARTVTLLHRYRHTPPLLAGAMGSMQLLPNGNYFVGWGTEPDFSEYTPSGEQILNGSFALGITSYRASRFPWSGQPATPPDMAAAAAPGGQTTIWASWNGATNVAWWRVVGGPTSIPLQLLAVQRDRRFETKINLSSQPAYVQVQALNAQGRILGTSAVQAVG